MFVCHMGNRFTQEGLGIHSRELWQPGIQWQRTINGFTGLLD
jgi:hypothetical protein